MAAHHADATVNGCRIHYALSGPDDADTIVLVNSLATDMGIWDAQVDAFSQRYRLLRYDARGHGRSETAPAPYSMDGLVDDLLALLAHVGARRTHIVGVSLGGLTALQAGIRAPAGIASIVACGSGIGAGPEFHKAITDRNALIRAQGTEAIADMMVGRWFTAPAFDEGHAYLARIRAMVADTSDEGFIGCATAIRDSGLRARIPEVKLPAMFVVGDQDAALPVEAVRAMQQEVDGARLGVVPGAGHLCNVEQPAIFNAMVLSFLARLR